MNAKRRVLLVGGTGRTGGRVLVQLLERGIPVRAIVRSETRLPEGVADHPLLDVVEADILSLPQQELQGHLVDCGTVISCLGHTTNLKGIFGPPFDLVAGSLTSLTQAAEALHPAEPIRFIVMSSVSVNRPSRSDTRRTAGERLVLGVLRALVPPARDNQRAADLCASELGSHNPSVEWVLVRPDTLLEGDVTEYGVKTGSWQASSDRTRPTWRTSRTSCASSPPTSQRGSAGGAECQ